MGRKSDVSLDRFFAELASRLDTARRVERDFDRKLAHRFNVFDYLREDELGLSRVIADLLDPEKNHGQGKLFLRTLLKDLARLSGTPDWPDVEGNQVSIAVKSEQTIPTGGRIDILVQIRVGKEAYGLAIENKPYAGDQKNQVQRYLEYLKDEYGDRFLLIYLSRNGEAPSEDSLPRKTLVEWKGRFAIMSYHEAQIQRVKDLDDFRLCRSLADWLDACRKDCEAERLRWFLEDFKVFCEKIGGRTVTDSERETAVQFVLSRDDLQTAQVVYESWPVVVDRVCEAFLETLCDRIKTAGREKLKAFAEDMCIGYQYSPKAWKSNVWLYRKHWNEYPVDDPTDRELRTSIRLQNQGRGPSVWIVGVSTPVDLRERPGDDYKKRWRRLEKDLQNAFGESTGKSSEWWPWYKDVRDWRDWKQLVPDLHRECQKQDDEIMTYFVDKFIEIAEKAIPVINDIERGE